MTPAEIEQLVKTHGGRIVGQIPDFGKGAVAAAQHAAFYQERMRRLRAQQTASASDHSLSVSVSEETARTLEEIAARASTPEERRSATDVAADILELAASIRFDEIRQLVTEHRKTG